MESDLYVSTRAACGPRKRRNVDRQDHLHVVHNPTSQLTEFVVATNRQLNYSFCKLDSEMSRNGKYLIHTMTDDVGRVHERRLIIIIIIIITRLMTHVKSFTK